jgi:hypothetical protein
MKTLDEAIDRMDAALTRLEAVFDAAEPPAIWGDETPEVPELKRERDQMADEIRDLRARADADAKLREEAATAVRDALRDLRGAMGEEWGKGSPANA